MSMYDDHQVPPEPVLPEEPVPDPDPPAEEPVPNPNPFANAKESDK